MTMTDERLAELDAVMAKATAGEWEIYGEPEVGLLPSLFSCETKTWPSRTPLEPLCRDDEAAIVALHNAYPDLRAHIEAQAATIARQDEALRRSREGWENAVELGIIPKQHRITAMILADVARAALAKIGATQ